MKLDLGFAYAQARIQARFAALPAEAEWERLAASRALASYLEEARLGSLRDWVRGFSGQSDVHDLELGLRALYRENLQAVADWVPVAWRQSVVWIGWLELLPLLAHLLAGGAKTGWVGRDPGLQALPGTTSALNTRYLEEAGATCLVQTEDDPVSTWVAEWRRRWPRCSREASRTLEELTSMLTAHVDTFRRTPPDSAWRLRRELRARLRLRFHRHALQPVIPFIYLSLMALDLERLRAALVSRALFATLEEPAWLETAGRFAA